MSAAFTAAKRSKTIRGLFLFSLTVVRSRIVRDMRSQIGHVYVKYALQRGQSCLDLVAARGWTESQISDVRDQRDRAYSALLADVSGPMEHVRQTLDCLRGRFRMAVVTTSKADDFYLMHRHFNLLEFFDIVITREDHSHPKPNPEPYRVALEPKNPPPGTERAYALGHADSSRACG